MHGFTSNSTVAWQVKRGPTATGSFNLPNGAVTPRISSPSDRNQMGRACSLQLQEKTSNRGCHEAVAMRDFWDWWFQLGALDIPKFQSIVDYLSICLSIYLSFFPGIFPGLGMSWASRQPIFQVEWFSMLVTARPGMLGWGVTVEARNF